MQIKRPRSGAFIHTCELNNLQDAMDYCSHRVSTCHWHQLIGVTNAEPAVSTLKKLVGVGRGRFDIVNNEVNRILEKPRKREKKILEQLDQEEQLLSKYSRHEEEIPEQWEDHHYMPSVSVYPLQL